MKESVITQNSKLAVDFCYSNEGFFCGKSHVPSVVMYYGSRFQGLFIVESAFSISS